MKRIQRKWVVGIPIELLPIKAFHTVRVEAKHGAVRHIHRYSQNVNGWCRGRTDGKTKVKNL